MYKRQHLTEAQEQARTAEARAGELRTELDHAHRAIAQLRIERNEAQQQISLMGEKMQVLGAEIATAKATLLHLEQQSADLRSELSSANKDNEQLREAWAQERASLEKAKAKVSTLEEEAQREAKRLLQAQKDAAGAEQKVAKLSGQIELYQQQHTDLLAKISTPGGKAAKTPNSK